MGANLLRRHQLRGLYQIRQGIPRPARRLRGLACSFPLKAAKDRKLISKEKEKREWVLRGFFKSLTFFGFLTINI